MRFGRSVLVGAAGGVCVGVGVGGSAGRVSRPSDVWQSAAQAGQKTSQFGFKEANVVAVERSWRSVIGVCSGVFVAVSVCTLCYNVCGTR